MTPQGKCVRLQTRLKAVLSAEYFRKCCSNPSHVCWLCNASSCAGPSSILASLASLPHMTGNPSEGAGGVASIRTACGLFHSWASRNGRELQGQGSHQSPIAPRNLHLLVPLLQFDPVLWLSSTGLCREEILLQSNIRINPIRSPGYRLIGGFAQSFPGMSGHVTASPPRN